jgi:hypothetical protein
MLRIHDEKKTVCAPFLEKEISEFTCWFAVDSFPLMISPWPTQPSMTWE